MLDYANNNNIFGDCFQCGRWLKRKMFTRRLRQNLTDRVTMLEDDPHSNLAELLHGMPFLPQHSAHLTKLGIELESLARGFGAPTEI